MNVLSFYIPEDTPALNFAATHLSKLGCRVSRNFSSDFTHLLLSIPTRELPVESVALPKGITILGGNLDHPALNDCLTVDLLKDQDYLAKNADITAHCAVRLAAERIPAVWTGLPVLILGWGRIGKCLARLLRSLGAFVTVAARKPEDRAMLRALGYAVVDTALVQPSIHQFRVIFNTVPTMVLSEVDTAFCSPGCIKIDLASKQGIAGNDVIWACGLPGKMAPESSGCLIAQTAVRLAAGGSL